MGRGCNAEFGVIDNFDESKDYGGAYEPQAYNCAAIDDDALSGWRERLETMRTYFHSFDRPETSLARYGVTLIPPASLELFYDIVQNDTAPEFAAQVPAVLAVIERAQRENKFIIHYGV